MNQNERLVYLIKYLCKERNVDIEMPESHDELFQLYRSLVNIREAKPIAQEFLKVQDQMLQEENKNKGIVSFDDVEENIIVWQGDITRLKVGAIVNAANNQMEGCFVPGHHCIDNAIHTYAGIRLRLACNKIMQGKEEETGKARRTLAYNLPSKYVIHTVGPIVRGNLTDKEKSELKSCYISCLDLARENNIRTIAFSSISTGVFSFPKDVASKIAVSTVRDYLVKYPEAFERVVFNVFTKEDLHYYERLFRD